MGARYLNTEVLGIPLERWLLYLIYWAVNLILALTDVDLTSLKYVGLPRIYHSTGVLKSI